MKSLSYKTKHQQKEQPHQQKEQPHQQKEQPHQQKEEPHQQKVEPHQQVIQLLQLQEAVELSGGLLESLQDSELLVVEDSTIRNNRLLLLKKVEMTCTPVSLTKKPLSEVNSAEKYQASNSYWI